MSKGNAQQRILLTGDYPLLESAFVDEVRGVRDREPFLPLLILISSRLLALHLRRLLAEKGWPHFNLRFWTLEDLAREITDPRFLEQGKAPVPPYADQLALGHIAESLARNDQTFYFRDIAGRPGFHKAVLSTIKDLKDACLDPGDLETLLGDQGGSEFGHSPELRNLLQIWKAYEGRLAELGWYDDSDQMAEAGKEIKASKIFDQTPKVLIYGFYDFNNLQKRLIQSCIEAKPTLVFLPYEPTPAFAFVKPTLHWLNGKGFKAVNPEAPSAKWREGALEHLCSGLFDSGKKMEGPSDAVRILSAPGQGREVSEVIRLALRISRDEKVPFHEIGILLRAPDQYFRLFHETLAGLGLKPYLGQGSPLVETRAGRSLLLLLGTLHQDFSRQSVMELATFARLRLDRFALKGETLPSPSRWDVISIKAGIVGGVKDWEERLRALKERWEKERPRGKDEEARNPHKEELESLDQLMRFAKELFKTLHSIQEANTWSGKVASLLKAFELFVEQDQEALQVRDVVRRLSGLDGASMPPAQADFTRVLEELLQNEGIPNGKFQRNGPAVLNLMGARGLPFKLLIVPGMVEKSFPPPMNQDAILLDHEREILNRALGRKTGESLPLKAKNRLEEERLLFRLAVGAATEKLVLSFPRMEVGTGKERLPSSFLLAAVKSLTGQSIDFQKLEQFSGFSRIPLSEIAVRDPQEALDEVEFDLSAAEENIKEERPEAIFYLKEISPLFSRGLRLEASRWGKNVFTGFEGVLSSEEARKALRNRFSIFSKSISPTRLETYAACPYQYLLKVIMRIEPFSEPERGGTINPLDKGKLIHSILYRFYDNLKKERGSPLILKPGDIQRLEAVAEEEFNKYKQMGLTGYSILWEVEKKNIFNDLSFLFHEDLADPEFLPAYFEVRYGMGPQDAEESEISSSDPVPISLGNRTLYLRGRIDRLDLSRDGKTARVIDYKSGRAPTRKTAFEGGMALQLPFYLYATEKLLTQWHRDLQVQEAQYLYLKDNKRVPFPFVELQARRDELQQILNTIGEGIEQGIFIAVPDPKCKYCDYRLACGSWKDLLFNLKKEDPNAQAFLKMRAGETAPAGEDSMEGEDEA